MAGRVTTIASQEGDPAESDDRNQKETLDWSEWIKAKGKIDQQKEMRQHGTCAGKELQPASLVCLPVVHYPLTCD